MRPFAKRTCPTEADLVVAKSAAIAAKKEYRLASDAYYATSDTKDRPEDIVRMQIEEMKKRQICSAAEIAYDQLWTLYKKVQGV